MNVNELKPSEEKQLTEEEKKKMVDEFLESMAKQHFAHRIKDVKRYLKANKLTLDEAIQEISNKKSKLTFSNREFLMFVKPEILNKWFNE